MFSRKAWVPGLSFVWYHSKFLLCQSWKWYTSYKRSIFVPISYVRIEFTTGILWVLQSGAKGIILLLLPYLWCCTFRFAGMVSFVVWISVWSRSTRRTSLRFLSSRSSSDFPISKASWKIQSCIQSYTKVMSAINFLLLIMFTVIWFDYQNQ